MLVHDWTRVRPGTFHHFHTAWITHLAESLNDGHLPAGFYAMTEQPAEQVIPDVLALEAIGQNEPGTEWTFPPEDMDVGPEGSVAVDVAPPPVRISLQLEHEITELRSRFLTIRHSSGDRIVALIEIASPGNKDRASAVESFARKVISALRIGYHVLIIDLIPPGPADPNGLHGAIWQSLGQEFLQPADEPLTLTSYEAGVSTRAWVEPLAVKDELPDMPLFLRHGWYVNVPLESTYIAAWKGVPDRWKAVIEDRD